MAILAQPPHDVFDVDDGVVDDLADRDGEAAEGHCVQRHAEAVQDDDGGEKRQRDRDARYRRRPDVEEKQEKDDDHEDAAQQERVADALRRDVDEGRRPEKRRIKLYALRFKRGLQRRERVLHAPRDLLRVRAELRRDNEDDAGLAHDRRAADRRLRRIGDRGDVRQYDACGAAGRDDGASDRRRRHRLSVAVKDDALVGRIEKAGAADRGGLA